MKLGFKKVYLLTLLISIAQVIFGQHVPSKERGDDRLRARGQMEGNRVRTTIHNFGVSGRTTGAVPFDVMTPYEWPKNTGKVYLAHAAIFVGGEVTDTEGNTRHIFSTPHWRAAPDGREWSFHPVPGYNNPDINSIATDIDPETWPEFWPDKQSDVNDPGWRGSWNGYFGKNIRNADQEMFYRASDDNYDRYGTYFPDSTDLTRKGLGIILDARVMAWSQALVQDVVFILHTIKNDGTENIEKAGVTLWYADFVGGNDDSNDDLSDFRLISDIAWSYDNDHKAPTFGNDPVGIIAITFLETPGNALDRIDNDGDGERNGPKVSQELLEGENPTNLVDDNGNGLIDENEAHIPFGAQEGVTYADRIDQNNNAEGNSPIVTTDMVTFVQNDKWKRWPKAPELDPIQDGVVHLLMVESDDVGNAFADNIDNDDDGEEGSPVITQAIIDAAALDSPYFRYKVPNAKDPKYGQPIILYNVTQECLGLKYADGVDNDGDGAIDEGIDEGIDEMIDEARDNGIDDDGDWNVLTDDVGLDGVPNTGDEGEGDGKPTTGAGTNFPGEPNIDITDVSETDQIGITSALYTNSGPNINSDVSLWNQLMNPGQFYDPSIVVPGEYDLWISSMFFPLKSGQPEPMSLAVILANGPANDPNAEIRKSEILRKKVIAQETYNNDYQFAGAPFIPTLTSVSGDNRVTLYWDDFAEGSFDRYINNIGGNGFDFEGYKIYRASDPAFEDIENITNAAGVPQFKTPIASFDLENGIKGLDPVGIAGAHFNLGDDSGIRHSWVDTTAKNGFTYYYAITSYDYGFPEGGIAPAESPIRITLKGDGSVILGQNVVRITPEAPAAGYIPASLGNIELVEGSTTGNVKYEIIDKNLIKDNHVYYISFEDTVKLASSSSQSDTLTTKNFTVIDSTDNTILIDRSTKLSSNYEQPIIDGFKLTFFNEEKVELNRERSGWNNPNVINYVFEKFPSQAGLKGEERPNDYQVIVGDDAYGTSTEIKIGRNTFPSVQVNFKVFNKTTNNFIEFGFAEVDQSTGEGRLSAEGTKKDRIIFLEPNVEDSLVITWWFYQSAGPDTLLGLSNPHPGDTAHIFLRKPFLSNDVFRFVASEEGIDKSKAKDDFDKIKVVPNPYVATAAWERENPYNTGRGPRSLHFIHLPARCTIRIFTINGELIDKIEHDSPFSDGTAYWDMLSKDNLSISYGIYLYHVNAPGIGEKVGKFAVIK